MSWDKNKTGFNLKKMTTQFSLDAANDSFVDGRMFCRNFDERIRLKNYFPLS